jgi:methyl-accepting chemotaxis protein
MNDGISSPKGLKDEWSLLLQSFLEDSSNAQALLKSEALSEVSLDQIQLTKKELSSRRKKMNQSIESIKIKIEQVSSVIENLELVGSDASGLVKEIDFLNTEGEKMSEEVDLIDKKIKKLHEIQDLLV